MVDGAGSTRCALLGDQLAELAETNNWAGVVVNGCIRDSAAINDISIGVKELGGASAQDRQAQYRLERDIPVRFAGVTFRPGYYLYADEDGLIVSEKPLT